LPPKLALANSYNWGWGFFYTAFYLITADWCRRSKTGAW